MEALIARYENGDFDNEDDDDDEVPTLVLTRECETRDQVDRLLLAAEAAKIQVLLFREPFFPLRRIREHLTREDFRHMIVGLSQLSSLTRLELAPTMRGMLRGDYAASTTLCGPHLRHYVARGAVTFAVEADVVSTAEAIRTVGAKLRSLELSDCFVRGGTRTSPVLWDEILEALSEASPPTLEILELSRHAEEHHTVPLLSPTSLFCLSSLAPSLTTLNLSRMGLGDDHFGTLSEILPTMNHLQWLCLDGNHPSRVGLQVLADAIRTHSSLLGLSVLHIWQTEKVTWSSIFPTNLHLQQLEVGVNSLDRPTEFWLSANQRSRADLLSKGETFPPGLWPMVLEALSDDPSILWYLLQTFSECILAQDGNY